MRRRTSLTRRFPSTGLGRKIAKLPVEDRAEAFHQLCRAYAVAMDQDTLAAAKWVETVMTGVRLLVAEIDKSGGRYLNVIPRFTR
jgi:hypothetical protein